MGTQTISLSVVKETMKNCDLQQVNSSNVNQVKSLTVVGILLLLILCTGCRSNPKFYPGPRRGPEEVVFISAQPPLAICGIGSTKGGCDLENSTFEVLPGTYEIECRYDPVQYRGSSQVITGTFLAGHRYTIRGHFIRYDRPRVVHQSGPGYYGVNNADGEWSMTIDEQR